MNTETYLLWKKLMLLCRKKRNGSDIPYSRILKIENELIKRGLIKNGKTS